MNIKRLLLDIFLLKVERLNIIKYMKNNSFEYKEGFFVIKNEILFEIIHLFYVNCKVFLFCRLYEAIKRDSFYNSIEIKPQVVENYEIFDVFSLDNPKSYEVKLCEGKKFIICYTLDVCKVLKT